MRQPLLAILLTAAWLVALPWSARGTDLRSVLTQYTIASWSEKDGLPDASIYVLAQDADGYLWVGTQDGPYRFDGVRFTPWASLVDETMPGRAARALRAGSDGSMWIGFGGQGGIAIYKDGLRRVYGTADGLPPATVSTLMEHPAGTWWAGTSLGLFRLRGERWDAVAAAQGVPEGPVSISLVNSQGRLLVGSSRSLLQFDERTDRFTPIAPFTEDVRALAEGPQARIVVTDQIVGYRPIDQAAPPSQPDERGRGRALLLDSRGTLWVGTAGQGLWRVRFDARGDVQSVEHATALTGLLADGVLSLAEDREGNIWAGTTEGINRLTPYKVTQVTGLGLVAGVERAHDSALWVGTVDELLLMSGPDAGGQSIRHVLQGARLRAMHTDTSGQLWVATDRGLTRWRDGSLVPVATSGAAMPRQIDTITSAPGGGVWVFDAERGLLRWHDSRFVATPLPSSVGDARVEAAFTDSTGRAWFSMSSGQVVATDGDTLRAYGKADGLDAGVYQAIYEDHTHAIWLGGTLGLTRYDGRRFVTVRSDAGFPVANLTAIVEDDEGAFWIGSGAGILQLRRADFDRLITEPGAHAQFRLFDRADGLAGLPFVYSRNRRAVRSADGRLWFVTGRGLTVLDPDALNTTTPIGDVRIDHVLSDGVRRRPDQGLVLPSGTNRVEFEYTVVNLTSPLRQQFRYMLEGFDRGWIEGGTRRQAVYTNLPPRNYRFRVSSTDLRGEWVEKDADWSFSIRPRFYQTGWFGALVIGAIGLSIGGAWRLHVQRVRRDFALLIGERSRLSRELHDTLLQSLVGIALQFDAMANDPRFSFSSDQRQQFVRMRKRVEEYMREARQSIADLRLPRVGTHDLSVALREAADRAINGHQIEFAFAQHGTPHPVPAHLEEELIKIGREAIGNAVRHAHAGRITAELEYADNAVHLRVTDDGSGFETGASTVDGHLGLTSMRERAEDLGGHLTIHSTSGSGTRVEAIVPLHPAHGRTDDEASAH